MHITYTNLSHKSIYLAMAKMLYPFYSSLSHIKGTVQKVERLFQEKHSFTGHT